MNHMTNNAHERLGFYSKDFLARLPLLASFLAILLHTGIKLLFSVMTLDFHPRISHLSADLQ